MGTLTNFGFEIVETMKKMMIFYKSIGFWDDYTFEHKGLNIINGSDKTLESLILYMEEFKSILDRLYVERTSRAIDQEVLRLMNSTEQNKTDYLTQNNSNMYYYCQPYRKEYEHLIEPVKPIEIYNFDPFLDRQENSSKIFKKVEKNLSLKCYTCDKGFSSRAALNNHLLIHSGKKLYCCEHCGKLLTCKRNLIAHLMRMHNFNTDQAHQCTICGKLFARKSTLETHVGIHKGIKPFSCHICNKTFAQKITRNVHLITHTGNYQFSCNKCLRKFPTRYKLNYHLKSHLNDSFQNIEQSKIEYKNLEEYICTFSNCTSKVKSFKEKQSLDKHIKRHHCDKTFFSCEHCSSQFVEKSSLKHHIIRNHTNLNITYKCIFCCKNYTLKSKLKRHMKIHTEEPNFKCEICGKRYHRSDALKKHKNSHIKSNSCTICDKKFKNQSCLNNHMDLHLNLEHTCLHCKKTFSSKLALEHHVANHNGNYKFICSVCGKGFVRKCHYDSHLGSHSLFDMFKCSVCGKGFKDIRYCKRHIKRSHEEGEAQKIQNFYLNTN